jgi:hypothetical protein
VDSGRSQRPVPQPTGHPLRGDHQPSGRHRQVAAVPETHRTLSQCPQAAAYAHCRSRRACMDGRLPAAAVSPPCSGAAAVSAVDSGRPASTRLHSQPHRGDCRGVRFRGHLLGFRARSVQPAEIDGPEAWTADAAGGYGQPAGARRCGHPRLRQGRADSATTPRWTAGSRTVHRHPNVRPGTGPQGAASASTAMASSPDRCAPPSWTCCVARAWTWPTPSRRWTRRPARPWRGPNPLLPAAGHPASRARVTPSLTRRQVRAWRV